MDLTSTLGNSERVPLGAPAFVGAGDSRHRKRAHPASSGPSLGTLMSRLVAKPAPYRSDQASRFLPGQARKNTGRGQGESLAGLWVREGFNGKRRPRKQQTRKKKKLNKAIHRRHERGGEGILRSQPEGLGGLGVFSITKERTHGFHLEGN